MVKIANNSFYHCNDMHPSKVKVEAISSWIDENVDLRHGNIDGNHHQLTPFAHSVDVLLGKCVG